MNENTEDTNVLMLENMGKIVTKIAIENYISGNVENDPFAQFKIAIEELENQASPCNTCTGCGTKGNCNE